MRKFDFYLNIERKVNEETKEVNKSRSMASNPMQIKLPFDDSCVIIEANSKSLKFEMDDLDIDIEFYYLYRDPITNKYERFYIGKGIYSVRANICSSVIIPQENFYTELDYRLERLCEKRYVPIQFK